MHVVISGYYGFDNVGDEAILFSIVQALRDVRPEITVTVLSNNPTLTRDTYQVQAINRWSFKEVNKAIKSANGLISGGGSLLQDKTGIRSIPYYTGIIKIAQWHKKPVFIYAQGMGPINRKINQWITKKILNRVNKITVRDTDSQKLLENIGVNQTSIVVPDPVLGLNGRAFSNDWIKDQQISGDFISVSVRDWPTDQPFQAKIAKTLDKLVQNGYQIVFVPMHGNHDDIASKATAALMNEKSLISPADLSIGEKISIIGQSKLLIGIRLHSLIFAAVNSIPFVALSYDPKIDAFAAICEQPIAGHIEHDDWDEELLFDRVSKSLENHVFQQDLLKNKVEVYQQEARNIPKLMLESFSEK